MLNVLVVPVGVGIPNQKKCNVFNRAKLCCVPIVNGEGNFHKLLWLFLAYRHSKNLDAVCPIEILKIGAATRIEVVIAGNARRTDEQAASKRELSPFSMSPKIERVGSITVMYPQIHALNDPPLGSCRK